MADTGTITFTGLASGIDTASWVDALVEIKQDAIDVLSDRVDEYTEKQSTITGLESTYSNLLSSLSSISDSNLSTTNMFNTTSATSSDTDTIVATSEYGIIGQSYSIEVSNLATQTEAVSLSAIANTIDGSTVFSSLSGAETGSFAFYVDNTKYSIDIADDDTLDDIAAKMEAETTDVSVSTSGGKFSIDAGSYELNVGTTTDESNLASILALKSNEAGTLSESSREIYDFDSTAALTGSNSGSAQAITAGTFTIGNAEFTIDETTTMDSIITAINTNDDAGVSASYNQLTGKFELVASDTGSFNINVENGTSNFLEAMGLTDSSGDIIEGSQAIGENAVLTINDVEVESFSNIVTSETTGVKGLSLTLKDTTEANSPITVSVDQDTTDALSAVNSFITEYNMVITKTDSLTDTNGILDNENSLVTLRNSLRTGISEPYTDNTTYKTLASIGISTGEIGSSVDDNTNQLHIDEEKFLAALAANPEEVKNLLIGDPTDGTSGVLGGIETIVENSLDNDYGYFAATNDSLQSQMDTLNDRIIDKEDSLEIYRESLTAQFTAMEQAISSLQSSYSDMISSIGSTTSSSS